jgi:hypothetical protein
MRRLLRSYDVEVQRVLEARARAAADARAAEDAESVRRQLEQTAAALEAAARTEAEQKAAAAAAAAAAARAEAARRKADEDKRRAKLEADAQRRAQKEAEELARAAAEEEHWRQQSRAQQQAEELAREAEEKEAAVIASLSCAACVARMRARAPPPSWCGLAPSTSVGSSSAAPRRRSLRSTLPAPRHCSGWPRPKARSSCCWPSAMCGATRWPCWRSVARRRR